jgi:hypothetical protein
MAFFGVAPASPARALRFAVITPHKGSRSETVFGRPAAFA